jgi:hypothetical protein
MHLLYYYYYYSQQNPNPTIVIPPEKQNKITKITNSKKPTYGPSTSMTTTSAWCATKLQNVQSDILFCINSGGRSGSSDLAQLLSYAENVTSQPRKQRGDLL